MPPNGVGRWRTFCELTPTMPDSIAGANGGCRGEAGDQLPGLQHEGRVPRCDQPGDADRPAHGVVKVLRVHREGGSSCIRVAISAKKRKLSAARGTWVRRVWARTRAVSSVSRAEMSS